MTYGELRQQVEAPRSKLIPPFVEDAVRALMRGGEDVGGGVNAIRLVRHLLSNQDLRDTEAIWAYDRFRPALRTAQVQIPSLCHFAGD